MKNSTVLELLEENMIPPALISYHVKPGKDSKRMDLIGSIKTRLFFTLISQVTFLFVFLCLLSDSMKVVRGSQEMTVAHINTYTIAMVLCVIFYFVGIMKHGYIRDLNKLMMVIIDHYKEEWGDFLNNGFNHQQRADEKLVKAALVVRVLQEKCPMETHVIQKARKSFGKIWKLFRKFELADDKWDRYFKEADLGKINDEEKDNIVRTWKINSQ